MKVALLCSLMGMIVASGCVSPRGFPPTGSIQNFDRVDNKLLRGAQFNHVGLDYLVGTYNTPEKQLTIINLRQVNDVWGDEEVQCHLHNIRYFNVPLNPLKAPRKDQVEHVLQLINDAPGLVYVHCQYGCDRTGTIVACYRIRHNNMTPLDALNDAEQHGLSAFEVDMKEFIKKFK